MFTVVLQEPGTKYHLLDWVYKQTNNDPWALDPKCENIFLLQLQKENRVEMYSLYSEVFFASIEAVLFSSIYYNWIGIFY